MTFMILDSRYKSQYNICSNASVEEGVVNKKLSQEAKLLNLKFSSSPRATSSGLVTENDY